MLHEKLFRKALEYFACCTDGKGIDNRMLYCAITALEKQIPKKIIDLNNEKGCPCCKHSFYIEDLNVSMRYDYCPDCGQKINWR